MGDRLTAAESRVPSPKSQVPSQIRIPDTGYLFLPATGHRLGRRLSPMTIRDLADSYWDLRHSHDHLWSLWAGDLTYLEQWQDFSAEGVAAYQAELLAFAPRANAAQPMSTAEKATARTIAHTAADMAAQLEWGAMLNAPNPEVGVLPALMAHLPRQPLVSADDGERYLAKLGSLPTFIEQLREALIEGAHIGVTPINTHIVGMVGKLDAYLGSPIGSDPFLRQAPPAAGFPGWRDRLMGAVSDVVRPALASYRETLATVTLPAARDDDKPGLTHLAGGDALYARRVIGATTPEHSPDSVHQIGLEQVAKLADEYRSVAGPVLGMNDLAAIFERLRSDPDLHYSDAAVLVADAVAALARATSAATDWFGRLPTGSCEVEATDVGALADYSSPAGDRPGRFFFNAADPARWGTFEIEATTFHEGVPGHHLQFALAAETEGLHPLHSQLYLPGYNEGWGLYTERLADEMGLYSSEIDRIGMLAADSMRACRLVIDTGLHALGWSRERAIAYMVENSPKTRSQCEGEIDRYIADPGQALGYMIGRLEIEDIRRDAEESLGSDFDIRAFHDVCLGQGTVSLDGLRGLVEAWTAGPPAGLGAN